MISAFNVNAESQEYAAAHAQLTCGCQKTAAMQARLTHFTCIKTRMKMNLKGRIRNSAITLSSCFRRNYFGADSFKAALFL